MLLRYEFPDVETYFMSGLYLILVLTYMMSYSSIPIAACSSLTRLEHVNLSPHGADVLNSQTVYSIRLYSAQQEKCVFVCHSNVTEANYRHGSVLFLVGIGRYAYILLFNVGCFGGGSQKKR